jgi:predicted DNA binding CopG/RHH family protein
MDKRNLQISRGIIPGYENGHYEPATNYDRSEFKSHSFEDPKRRDNRISIRVSGKDLEQLHKLALEAGVPAQSLIGNIVHKYVNGLLLDPPDSSGGTRAARITDTEALLTEDRKHPAEFARAARGLFRRDFK